MRYYCRCGRIAFLERVSISLIFGLFEKLLRGGWGVYVLCDECGKAITYRDFYGLGV